MIALYILLIIAAIIALILIIPVKIIITANINEQEIKLKYAFLTFKLFPNTNNKDANGDAEKEEKPKKEKKKSSLDRNQIFQLIPLTKDDFFKLLRRLLDYIFKHFIKIRELNIKGTFGTGDPAYTGMMCGAVYTGVYTTISKLERKAGLKKFDVDIDPNFDNMIFNIGAYVELRTRIYHFFAILNIILIHGLKIFGIYSKFKKQMKGNENNG